MSKRLNFSRKVRRAIIERAAGHCERCKAALKVSEGEAHHILEAELGGKAEVANGLWICKPCHKELTKKFVRDLRKHDRARDRHTGAMPSAKAKIKSAGFAKKSKRDQLPLPPRHAGHLMSRGVIWKASHREDQE